MKFINSLDSVYIPMTPYDFLLLPMTPYDFLWCPINTQNPSVRPSVTK